MYVKSNNEARSCNHCCSGKAISNTYSECVFVALGIQPTMRMHHTVNFRLSASRTYPTLSHIRHDFRGGKKKTEHKFVLIFSTTFVRNTSHSKNLPTYYEKCTQVFMQSICYSCHILMKAALNRKKYKK
jgi:hypothetical protein